MATNTLDKLIALGTVAVGLAFIETAAPTALDTYVGLTVAIGGLLTLVGAHTASTVMSLVDRNFLGGSSGQSATKEVPAAKSL